VLTADAPEIRQKLRDLASERRRFGYRRLGILLGAGRDHDEPHGLIASAPLVQAGAQHSRQEDAMPLYVGLDISQKETEICVVDEEGRRIWRGRCPSRPESIIQALQRHAPELARVGMETGPLAIWLWHGLRALGVPVDCLHARHVAAALSLQVNKTDANDAHGIAQVVRAGWYRPVVVKSLQSCRVRAVLSARSQLVAMRTSLYNQIRGLLKTFGVVLAPGKGATFEAEVLSGCPTDPLVQDAIAALLAAWRVAGERKRALELQLVRLARGSDTCRRMATVPGVGAITALTFMTAIDNPERFRRSSAVNGVLNLTQGWSGSATWF
jgi:transposase